MRLSDEQYEEIKQTVIDTFVAYDVKGIPINGFELATKMGITIVPYSSLKKEQRRYRVCIKNICGFFSLIIYFRY